MNNEGRSLDVRLAILGRRSNRVEQLVSDLTAMGRGWKGAPPPLRVVVWTLTWLVVGGLLWVGDRLGVTPPVHDLPNLLRMASWLP